MFHRPSAIGGDAGLSSRPRSVLLPQGNNENSMPSKDTTTPAKSLQQNRRAFGDISNKKSSNGGPGGKDGNQNFGLKPRSSNTLQPSAKKSNAFTPSRSIQQFPSRIPKTAGSKSNNPQKPGLSKRAHPWSTQAKRSSSSTLSSSSPAPIATRQVDFILPTSTRKAQVEVQSNVNTQSISKRMDPVEDVELPAGRLWAEQLRLEGDDEASTSSLADLLEGRTMWDDYKESLSKEWEAERQRLAKEDEDLIQAKINKILIEDDDQGELNQFQFSIFAHLS